MSHEIADLYSSHAATVKDRYERALAETGFDHVAIYSGAEHIAFLDDKIYPFNPNPHFLYWVPLTTVTHSFVIHSGGSRPVLVYYQPVDYWYKPSAPPSGFWVDQFDIRTIVTPEEARAIVPRGGRTAFIGEWNDEFASWGFAEANPKGLIDRLHFDRAVKTPYEVECIRESNRIGARGHIAAARAFRDGGSEYDIHVEYLKATGHTEAQLPYSNIVAINQNAAVLHYQYQERQGPAQRHSFLIDAGASTNGYASDITRTYSSGNGEFRALIDAVDSYQQELCRVIRPGFDYRELQAMAHRKAAEVLEEFGFIDLDPEAIVEMGISRAFFPHGIGHLLGIQVHDVGGFLADREGHTIPKPEGQPYLRLTRVVEPGFVFTVEPGIYFIDSLLAELQESDEAQYVNWPKIDSFRKYGGIRIEDNILVTPGGHENLTRPQFESA